MAEIIDKVILSRTERIPATVDDDRLVARPIDTIKVPTYDAWKLVPAVASVSTEYTIPQSILDGGYINVEQLRNDLFTELRNLEIATIDTTRYTNDLATQAQQFTDLQAVYVNNEDLQAKLLATDLSQYNIGLGVHPETGLPLTFASMQEIYDRAVLVDNAQATFTDDLQAYADNVTAYVQESTILSASLDDVDVRLATEEGVSIGTHVWDGLETPRIGMKRTTSGYSETYMGGILGWVRDTQINAQDAQATANTAYAWAAGASSFVTNPTTGAITGWNYADGSSLDGSQFVIQADKFKVADTIGSSLPIFTIDAVSRDAIFNGKVSFTNTTGKPVHVTSVTQVTPSASTVDGLTGSSAGTPVKGSTYTYTGGTSNVMYTFTASGWEQGGNPDAITASEVADAVNNNTTKIDGSKIVTGTLFSQNIGFTGKITGGSGGLGGIIQSANYVNGVSGMKIDLVNGSIYIA